MKYEENNYILTSIEIDEQFVDNASDTYMTDEERSIGSTLKKGCPTRKPKRNHIR